MLFDGIKLVEGSEINNLVVQTGTSWPTSPSEGELFYMKEGGVATEGLYVYDGAQWLMTNNEFTNGDIISALGYTPANKAGDTFSGPVILSGAPSQALEAATKGYVDAALGAVGSSAQPLDADLTAISSLSGTGILRRTGVDTWSLDTSTYLTGNQNISVSGDATGSGSTSINLTLANSGVAAGSYGTASSVSTVAVDAKGRVVSASNTPIAVDASQVTTGTFANARISQGSVTQHQAALTITESQITDGALLARNAGNETITGTWSFSVAPTSPMPTAGGQVANKDYVDNIAAGVSPQRSVKVASTANISLTGLQTIDGYAVQAGDRVLVKDQSTGSQNGVYVAAAGAWSRSADFDGSPTNEVSSGALVYVEQGTANGNSSWVLVTADPITIGTTSLSFSIFSRPGDFVAGAGLTKTGNQFDVGTASTSRIVVNADNIDLAAVGTAGTYTSVTTDAYGRVTAGSNPGFITGNQNITVSGDATGSGTTAIALTLANSGVTAGTYNNSATQHNSFTVDAKGRVTSVGAAVTITPAFASVTGKPTTLAGYGITDAVLKTGDTMSGSLTFANGAAVVGTNSSGATSRLLVGHTSNIVYMGAIDGNFSGGVIIRSNASTDNLTLTPSLTSIATSTSVTGTLSVSSTTANTIGGATVYGGFSSALNINYTGSGTAYGLLLKPSTSTGVSNAISFLTSTSTSGSAVAVGAIQHLTSDAGLNLFGQWTLNSNTIITSGNIGSQSVASAVNVTGTVAVANGGTGATTAEGATTNIGASRINPTNPKDGDIRITAGPVISIYATGAWRQVFPAVYS